MVSNPFGLLWADPGGGKTSVTLKSFAALICSGQVKRLLIVAPLRPAHLVWPAEQEKWADFEGLRVRVLHGPKKEAMLAEGTEICVINPEGLEWLFGVTEERKMVKRRNPFTGELVEKVKVILHHDMARIRSLGFDALVVDEVTMYKNSTKRRFQVLKPVLPLFKRRWGLTGTPATNGLIDLFGQVYVADRGRTFGQFITGYRREYFQATGWGGYKYEPMPDAEKRILKALKPIVFRLDAKEYADDIPKLVPHDVLVELTPKARKAYNEMEKLMFTELEGKVFTAVSAGVATGKCRQIAGGGLFLKAIDQDDDRPLKKGEWALVHEAKTEALEELVESLQGRPALIAYEFTHELERIKKAFGSRLEVMGKGTSMKKTKELERAWNAGEIELLAGHPRAIGHGLNLQESSNHVIWHTPTWDLELYDQFIRRVLRSGNPHAKVYVHHILAIDTVDSLIMQALALKGAQQQRLLDAFTIYKKMRRAA